MHLAEGHYVVAERPDGSVESRPMDTDQPDWDTAVFDADLADRIRALARAQQVAVEFRELAGETGRALSRRSRSERGGDDRGRQPPRRVARQRARLLQRFGCSHLAHRQPRPLVVVPVTPLPEGARAPWEQPA